ncbi:hypothetical protein IV38_GL001627 [Lactobacillus selangorensis]|uniref:Uncharacterized protein n=1 Tax=Lactobacillus selangorensis TaxID=81857 RepID=A0A0R2FX30_9LACO|nr:hypothetical protein [Lactobacillus selangorensis]KRN28175.1 hypothetical protein IV38_GL001627 [Lactobacillus selangorensis]KRN30949.1 hypothetical protein IV40_GL001588 [Lactobacillus selangorensis]
MRRTALSLISFALVLFILIWSGRFSASATILMLSGFAALIVALILLIANHYKKYSR